MLNQNQMASRNMMQVKQIMNNLRTIGNPQAMLQQMPQYKEMIEFVNANGGDARSAFFAKAKEMGINPSDVLSQLRD